MKPLWVLFASPILAVSLSVHPVSAGPLGTAFSFQGQILKSGVPVTGTVNLQFTLFNAANGGAQVGGVQTFNAVTPSGGLFSLALDFGANAFDGNERWLEIAVEGSGENTFTTLSPRTPVLPTPYALYAVGGGGGGGGLALPYAGTGATNGTLFSLTNTTVGGTGLTIQADNTAGSFTATGVSGFGVAASGTARGVSGTGQNEGVYGSSFTGFGVHGFYGFSNFIPNGDKAGVYGNTTSNNVASAGTRGDASYGYGVQGTSASGVGVFGHSDTGHGIVGSSNGGGMAGVYGSATAGNGFGGYFTNPNGTALYADGLAQVKTLQILGADLAESFRVSEADLEPGTVLVIDVRTPGALRTSEEAYSHRVAGVVSGANGLDAAVVLEGGSFDDAGHVAVAMSGRVWVKCDATVAPIHPGDLLTTAARAGHAMRADDRERAYGAILGKAMTSLEAGTGLVLVLVNLQ